MTRSQFEEEINEASLRLEDKKLRSENEVLSLQNRIVTYEKWAWGCVGIGIVVIAFAVFIFYFNSYRPEEYHGYNLMGDFLAGSVGSIWSLAGLFFVYIAFLGQKVQILQQQLDILSGQLELKYTRLQIMEQKKEMVIQNETLHIQLFENKFFQLLGLLNSIVDSLEIRSPRDRSVIIGSGRLCFTIIYENMKQYLIRALHPGLAPFNPSYDKVTLKLVRQAYQDTYEEYNHILSHYFRTLYRTLKFVDDSTISNKEEYTGILRAQLSSYEQALLFYNCIHIFGLKKFKPKVDRYKILENLDIDLIFNKKHLKQYSHL